MPSVLFSDSEFAAGLQVADRFAYVLRLNEQEELYRKSTLSDPYFSTIKRYAGMVWSKNQDYDLPDVAEGFICCGISTITAEKFDYGPPSEWSSRDGHGVAEEATLR